MTDFVLAIDQGTTSSRALLFDDRMTVVAGAQEELPQIYPRPGWVEHDPEAIWRSTLATARAALAEAGAASGDVAAIGITNQRETTLVWERDTGRVIHNAIVWQDRRTSDVCQRLRADGAEAMISARTGLLADPYFSATKLAFLLDNVEGARSAAEAGRLAFGTVDSFLLSRLTGGRVHATDATNASRTMLYDIQRGTWCDELLALFGVPRAMLPEVRDSAGDFGATETGLFDGTISIQGMAGDQQAAAAGQACFRPGMLKATYGTGCFALLATGEDAVASQNRLLTTVALQLDGRRTYALEGAIFVAGAAVQWLRDGLGIIAEASEMDGLAAAGDPAAEVYLVPAFAGLGAPWWDAEARGALLGLTRGTGRAEIARATLESVCFQTNDLIEAMRADWRGTAGAGDVELILRVDGGMTASQWTMQRLADTLALCVERPANRESTALGAAWLAGMAAGVYPDAETFASGWAAERRFVPSMEERERERRIAGWRAAIARVLTRPAGA
ncbi:MAG: glycerol kinase GlpK [Rhizobiales bacterium]|nr:glycerol kinase GlpK [Hyphomicrobiales bacterium]